jgi:hypothetical protein
MPVLPPGTVVAQSVVGGLGSDGSTVVWSASSNQAAGGTSQLIRMGPGDTVPVTVTTVNDGILATTIHNGTVYFATSGGYYGSNMGRIMSVPLAASGGTATPLVSSQTITNSSNPVHQTFIQTDGTTVFWTTESDSVTPTGTLQSTPVGGGAATAVASSLGQPSGLLRANSITYYTTLGTSAKNYIDGVLSATGASTSLDSMGSFGDVQLDLNGNLVYVKGTTILSRPMAGGSATTVYQTSDPMCKTAVSPCPYAFTVFNGRVYFVGYAAANFAGEVGIFRDDGQPIAGVGPAGGAPPQRNLPTVLVGANGALFWIAQGSLWKIAVP